MTRRQELDHHLVVLTEVKGILGAMKNLALVEIRKLARLRAAHHQVVETIGAAVADFLAFYPADTPHAATGAPLVLLAGSERGFCGTFNELLLEEVERAGPDRWGARAGWLPVGNRIGSRLEGQPQVLEWLPGPNAAEEVVGVLINALSTIVRLAAQRGGPAETPVWVAYHDPERGSVSIEELTALPPPAAPAGHGSPPYLQLEPGRLMAELIEHYLFAALTRAFYASLTAENRFRLAHMEHAGRRIETTMDEMALRRNMLRQEEVTQEVALILQTAEVLAPPLRRV
ncbi:MAG: F0F1 ATP synthase subunit gamma [Candidatus Lambdaproteobacteria bacterium]|nr:F0F1 ATP synthase subunit gamma [Candidatus Lambdaproteobacteria bacterium]